MSVYNPLAPTARREQAKARSGSSVWLERSPVTAEVAGSSPVRFVYKKKDVPTGHPFFVYAVAALIPAPSSSEPARQAARLRLKSPVGFSDPGGADTSAPFTPATPGPGGGRGFLLAPSGASTCSTHFSSTLPTGHPFFCLRSRSSYPRTLVK